jgi:capsule biosynthesis phosphatase
MTKFIILCGGIGRRNNQYSLPKPLNYINGRHMIEYIIDNIPSQDIYIIYNIALAQYNFEEIIVNRCKSKHFYFAQVEYLTRGAVETARIGITKFLENPNFKINDNLNNESLVFLDNDNIHTIPDSAPFDSENCIGYSKNYDKNRTNYSFITILDGRVQSIEEKIKISDDYCCGIYGFQDVQTFLDYSSRLILTNNKTKNEFYFSQMYKMMLLDKLQITPVHIQETRHVGTLQEIKQSLPYLDLSHTKRLRICFDLDNTLVSYPSIPGDYTTVRPITANIQLLNSLKKAGHEIIIYTARRMATHKHNIGRVMKDIALITLESLEMLGIEYDEIIFGKPIADIYIDDRAINPYLTDISYFGLMFDKSDYIPNKLENNKYNSITRHDNKIIKTGPYSFMRGELHFYQMIPNSLKSLFPGIIDFNKIDDKLELTLEYINGIPLYYLYKNQLLTEAHIDKLFNILDALHGEEYTISISPVAIHNNYFKKLETRFNPHDYFFNDARTVFEKIKAKLEITYNPNIVGIIHGDFWFSNILLDYDDNLYCLDMKGQVDDQLTLNGDMYYDYGKLYQSILGYDLILNNCLPTSLEGQKYMQKIKTYFIDKCKSKGLDIMYLEATTISLIFGVFHSLNSNDDKIRIWAFLKNLISI